MDRKVELSQEAMSQLVQLFSAAGAKRASTPKSARTPLLFSASPTNGIASPTNWRSSAINEQSAMEEGTPEKIRIIATISQRIGENGAPIFNIEYAAPKRSLSSRAVTVSKAVDNTMIATSIGPLLLLMLELIDTFSGKNDGSDDEKLPELTVLTWISIGLSLLVPLSALKNKILDCLKR